MNYLFTAAGNGSRFLDGGIKPPKPLIRARGRELLLWSLNSFRYKPADSIFIVTQKRHYVPQRLDRRIRDEYPFVQVKWLELDTVLNGQLITALTAIKHFSISGPLVIHNCDSSFDGSSIDSSFFSKNPSVFGLVPCFESEGDHWSFFGASINDPTLVTKVAEKERISKNCSIGAYAFRSADELAVLAHEYLGVNESPFGEYYIAPLYQYALTRNLVTRISSAPSPRLFGTPSEVMRTFTMTHYDLLSENAWDANQRKTLVVDIDDTICHLGPDKNYSAASQNIPVCQALRAAHSKGVYIILFTSRNMRTFRGCSGLINKYTAPVILEWLSANQIPFDEIYFGKPWGANVSYLDDKSISLQSFLVEATE